MRSSGNTRPSSCRGSEADTAAVFGQRADLVPSRVEYFGEPRAGQGEQAQRRHRPRVYLAAPVQRRTETFELLPVEIAHDGPPRVHDDVGAGVGDMLAKLAPLACGIEHGAQCLEGAVGRAGHVRAHSVELCRDAGMVDGVQPEPAEVRHQVMAHGTVPGLERGRLPAAIAPLAVAGGEVAGGGPGLASGRRRLAVQTRASTVPAFFLASARPMSGNRPTVSLRIRPRIEAAVPALASACALTGRFAAVSETANTTTWKGG